MAQNTSRKRSQPFVPRSQRDALGAAGSQTPPRMRQAPRAASPRTPVVGPSRPPGPRSTSAPRKIGQALPPTPLQQKVERAASTGARFGRAARIGLPVAAAAGGAGYLVHRSRQKQLASKALFDPFAKAYPIATPVPRSVVVAALRPTGRHLGHGQDLKHVSHNAKHFPSGPFKKGLVDPFEKGVSEQSREFAQRDPKVNSKIPDSARQGRRFA